MKPARKRKPVKVPRVVDLIEMQGQVINVDEGEPCFLVRVDLVVDDAETLFDALAEIERRLDPSATGGGA